MQALVDHIVSWLRAYQEAELPNAAAGGVFPVGMLPPWSKANDGGAAPDFLTGGPPPRESKGSSSAIVVSGFQ